MGIAHGQRLELGDRQLRDDPGRGSTGRAALVEDLDRRVDARHAAVERVVARGGAVVEADRRIAVIDERIANILARIEALTAALEREAGEVLIDGNRCPALPMEARAVVKGDSLVAAISAASILAKVTRDAEMTELDSRHPEYGFARHKGYPTAEHLAILAERGPLPEYRQSFKPVRRALGIE